MATLGTGSEDIENAATAPTEAPLHGAADGVSHLAQLVDPADGELSDG